MDIPQQTVPPQDKYPVRVYDSSLDLVGEYSDYASLEWIRRWRKPGEFTLNISRYNYDGSERVFSDFDFVNNDFYISIYRGDVARIARIDTVDITLNQAGRGGETWTFTGPDGKGLLTDAISLAGVSTGTGYDSMTTTAAETIIRHLIDRNTITALDETGAAASGRVKTGLILESVDGAKGGSLSYQARLQYLTDNIEEILLASTGIGYEVVFLRPTKQLKVVIKAGTDRSASVKFADNLMNVRSLHYRLNKSAVKNVVYVGGTGTDAARSIVTVPASGAPTGLTRREDFLDGSATDNSSGQLTALGNAKIQDCGSAQTMEFENLPDNSFVYMDRNAVGDYDLGDLVKVVYSGIATMTGRIIECKETYGGSGYPLHLNMTVGTEVSDEVKIIRNINKKASTGGRK